MRKLTISGFENLKEVPKDKESAVTKISLSSIPWDDVCIIQKFKNLERVSLSKIEGDIIPPRLFQGLTKLRGVWVGKHTLTTLPNKLFTDCPNLRGCGFYNGKLRTVPETLFYHNKQLKHLNLQDNCLETLPENFLQSCPDIEKLSATLRLTGNPFTNIGGVKLNERLTVLGRSNWVFAMKWKNRIRIGEGRFTNLTHAYRYLFFRLHDKIYEGGRDYVWMGKGDKLTEITTELMAILREQFPHRADKLVAMTDAELTRWQKEGKYWNRRWNMFLDRNS